MTTVGRRLPKLFISYSREDIAFQKSLVKHLAGLRNKIVTWNDQDMLPGEEWDDSVKANLRSADVVLYLVTHNSIATDYIQNVELPLIEDRCQNKACVLIPVIVDFCYWDDLYFAKYNALPNKGVPITDKSWANQNEAWLMVVQGVKRIIEKITNQGFVTSSNLGIPEPETVTKPHVLAEKSVKTDPLKALINELAILSSKYIDEANVKADRSNATKKLKSPRIIFPRDNRGWQSMDHFQVKNGLARDIKKGLLWLRFSYGQTWENEMAQGQAIKMDWDSAFGAAVNFNLQGGYAGLKDWRLPTIEELKTLINKREGNQGKYIHPDVFPNNDGAGFWSSSSDAPDSNGAYGVYFDDGYEECWNLKTYNNQVLLVRRLTIT